MTPQYLGTNSVHFPKYNTNNNNELIKEKNKLLTGFQLKSLVLISCHRLFTHRVKLESFFSCVRIPMGSFRVQFTTRQTETGNVHVKPSLIKTRETGK